MSRNDPDELVKILIRDIRRQVRDGLKVTAFLRGVSMNKLIIEILTKFVRENTEHNHGKLQ